jgi:hypothetical protein
MGFLSNSVPAAHHPRDVPTLRNRRLGYLLPRVHGGRSGVATRLSFPWKWPPQQSPRAADLSSAGATSQAADEPMLRRSLLRFVCFGSLALYSQAFPVHLVGALDDLHEA